MMKCFKRICLKFYSTIQYKKFKIIVQCLKPRFEKMIFSEIILRKLRIIKSEFKSQNDFYDLSLLKSIKI